MQLREQILPHDAESEATVAIPARTQRHAFMIQSASTWASVPINKETGENPGAMKLLVQG